MLINPTPPRKNDKRKEERMNCEIRAGKDGLWLTTPKKQGVQECINLLSENRMPTKRLWQKLFNAPPDEEVMQTCGCHSEQVHECPEYADGQCRLME